MSSRHTVQITIEANAGDAQRIARGIGDEFDRTGQRVEQAGGRVSSGMDKTAQGAGRLNAAIVGVAATIGSFAGNAALGLAERGLDTLVTQMGESVRAASDLEESVAKTGEVFRDQTAAVMQWSESSAQAFGQSKQDALEAASTFGNLFTAMGLATGASADMSTELVELAADLASFNNIEIAEAITALRAGMVGETEPMRRLGVQLSATAVEAKALELGLAATSSEITESDKVTARYKIILEQTTTAQGDFARTSDGLANQQRIQQAQWEDLQATIGQGLLPVMTELTGVMNQLLGSGEFQAGMENIAQGMERWTNAAVFAVGATKDLAGIFDELSGTTEQVRLGFDLAGEGAEFFGARIGDVSSLVGDAKGALQELHIVAQDDNWADGFLEWLAGVDLRSPVVAQKTEEVNEKIERSKQIMMELRIEEVKRAAIQATLQAQMVGNNAAFEEYVHWLTVTSTVGSEFDRMTLDSLDSLTRQDDILHSARESMDAATRSAMQLSMAQSGLADTYQLAGENAAIFNAQGSEYNAIASDLTDAYDILNERKKEGIELTDEETRFLEGYEQNLGRVEGGMDDATVQAGLYRAAQVDLMDAQDALNDAIKNGAEDLTPYQQAVDDAEGSLNDAATASGGMRSANDLLVDLILTELIPALSGINDLLTDINNNPATAKVDADTSAAYTALQGFKDYLANHPATIDLYVNQINEIGFTKKAAGGPIHGGQLALVGEEGPELIVPQGDVEVFSNPDTMRMLSLMSDFAGGFAGGTMGVNTPAPTSGGSLGTGGGFNPDAFVDIGTMIAEAINLGIELELIDSGAPTGAQFAAAIIEGATEQIDTDGDEVVDAWIVNMERIPELAATLGQDTVLGLLEQYSDLQGELQLAILSGEDTGEIQAQIDAIFAIFAAWSGNTVEEVEAVWDAVTDEARAAEAQALFESLFGSISLPGPTLSFDLEDLLSGDAEKDLQAAGDELWALYDIYVAAGMDEAAAKVLERIADLDLQDDFIDGVLGTDTAQQMMDEYAAQVEAADAEEAQKAAAEKIADIWDTVLSVPIDELASGDYIAKQQERLAGLYDDLSIAEALGLEEQAADIRAAIEEQEYLLYAAGEAMATPVVEAAAEALAEIPQISADTLDDLAEIFGDYPDVAEGMIDDLIQAVVDGRVPFEDAMNLIAMAPEEDLIPTLEDLEEQLTVDLAEALLSLGPDSPEVQAILASLGLVEDALDAAGAATRQLTDEQLALQAGLGNAPGEKRGGGTGTAGEGDLTSDGSTGFLSGNVMLPASTFGPGPYDNGLLYDQSLAQNPGTRQAIHVHNYMDSKEIAGSTFKFMTSGTPAGWAVGE